MKEKIIELLKQYEDAHTQGVYRCDYDEIADEVVKLFCQPDVMQQSEQLVAFLEWLEANSEHSIDRSWIDEYIEATNCA